MDDYYSDNQPELIHCEYCGEDYAPMYKACPFCNTAPNGKKVRSAADRSRSGGSRVRTNTRGGGYGGARSPMLFVGLGIVLVLVIVAIVLVVALLKPLLASLSSDNSAGETSQSGIVSYIEDTPEEDTAANSVTISQTELALDEGGVAALTVTVDPEDWTGTVSWASDNTEVATVDESGNVTYVAEGTCTISATVGGQTATCVVTCNSAVTPEPIAVDEIVVTAFGNTMDGDFTIGLGESIPFKATGGDGTNYVWSIEDGGIATVDASGTCVGVAVGKTSMTVTSGGVSTTVTIRVK